jgi:hypothetical protein
MVSYRHVVIYDDLTCTQRGLDNASSTTMLVDAAFSVLLFVRYEVELIATSTTDRVTCHVYVCV